MRSMIIAAATMAAPLLALTACGTSAVAPKPQATATTFSVPAATLKACKIILAFQNGNSTRTFANDPSSVNAELAATDTPLEVDLTDWVNDLQGDAQYQQIEQDANKVGADCGAVGVKLFAVASS
ncbi:MAG TPA: hypothetical protein VNV62_02245 [Trebonia sp.]|jgi:hypothetical protein|nr:hypothetical protein [Trebonia sp.]